MWKFPESHSQEPSRELSTPLGDKNSTSNGDIAFNEDLSLQIQESLSRFSCQYGSFCKPYLPKMRIMLAKPPTPPKLPQDPYIWQRPG